MRRIINEVSRTENGPDTVNILGGIWDTLDKPETRA